MLKMLITLKKDSHMVFSHNMFVLLQKLILFLLSLSFFLLVKSLIVIADPITTAVTVGNNPPSITDGPRENPTSSVTTPTDVGSDTTFEVTAIDSNGDDYYLIVCSSDSVTPANGGAPSCGATTWCTSTNTTSGSQASCSRTALAGDTVSNNWYAFVCDGDSSFADCTDIGNQGTGDSGSPFEVNHAPSFTAVSNDSPKDPGATITWSTTSSDSTDSDTVKLIVCKTAGITGDACDGGAGDTWCSSSQVASNPTCGYSIPSVAPDGSNDAYVYIVDGHNFPATGVYQASNVSFTINNTAPVVSAVTINGGVAIDLTESTTKAVTLTATVTDNNSCFGGEIATVYGYAYRSSITYAGCDTAGEANNDYCYPEITCTVVGGSCTDNTDASANYTCTANIYYYADPTDTATEYPSDTWLDTIKAIDDDTASHNLEVSTGVEMNSLIGFELGYTVTGSINYGNLGVGEKNDPLDKITTTTPTGNIGLDQEHSANSMCVDYPTCSGGTPITASYQHFALASSTAYASGTALTGSAVEYELNVPKVRAGSVTTKNVWWGIEIPAGTALGTYSGANTISAVKGETTSW